MCNKFILLGNRRNVWRTRFYFNLTLNSAARCCAFAAIDTIGKISAWGLTSGAPSDFFISAWEGKVRSGTLLHTHEVVGQGGATLASPRLTTGAPRHLKCKARCAWVSGVCVCVCVSRHCILCRFLPSPLLCSNVFQSILHEALPCS